ncbi:MAG: hypothetical protein RLZZ458_710 [Planctomycetota bacterium]|jgi:hypothetical protein
MRLSLSLLLLSGMLVGCGGPGNTATAPAEVTPPSTEEKPSDGGLPAPPPLPPKPAD